MSSTGASEPRWSAWRVRRFRSTPSISDASSRPLASTVGRSRAPTPLSTMCCSSTAPPSLGFCRMFHDRAQIKVQAGRGGDGSLHFRREKHVPKGGPDGGDGGPGGDVVIAADAALRDLSAFRMRKRFKAGNGEPGRGALKHGATGATAEVRVPVGTQVFDEDEQLIADLASADAHVVVARGGGGGRGNKRFASPTLRTPRFAETGLPGQEAMFDLRLKLLADAALV